MRFSISEITVLRETFLFQQIPDRTYSQITINEDIRFTRLHLRTGAYLNRHEEEPMLGTVISGQLLERKGETLRVLSAGSMFGELELFSPHPENSPELRARSACSLLFFPASQIRALFVQYPDTLTNFILHLTQQIKLLQQENRLRGNYANGKKLGNILAQYWEESPEGYEAQLPYSLTDLAGYLGISRSSLYRLLADLESDGVLSQHGRAITVRKPEKLL